VPRPIDLRVRSLALATQRALAPAAAAAAANFIIMPVSVSPRRCPGLSAHCADHRADDRCCNRVPVRRPGLPSPRATCQWTIAQPVARGKAARSIPTRPHVRLGVGFWIFSRRSRNPSSSSAVSFIRDSCLSESSAFAAAAGPAAMPDSLVLQSKHRHLSSASHWFRVELYYCSLCGCGHLYLYLHRAPLSPGYSRESWLGHIQCCLM
jgi:hypothetical protein